MTRMKKHPTDDAHGSVHSFESFVLIRGIRDQMVPTLQGARRAGLRRFALAVSVLLLAACHASTTPTPSSVPPLLDRAEQLVVVTTPDWDSTSGTLHRFVRAKVGEDWRPEGSAGAVASTRKRSRRRHRTSARAMASPPPACFRSTPRSGSPPPIRRAGFGFRTSSSPPVRTVSTTRRLRTTTPSSIARRSHSTGRARNTCDRSPNTASASSWATTRHRRPRVAARASSSTSGAGRGRRRLAARPSTPNN